MDEEDEYHMKLELCSHSATEFVDMCEGIKQYIQESHHTRFNHKDVLFTHTENNITFKGKASVYYNSSLFLSPHSPNGTLTIQTVFIFPRGGKLITKLA